MSAFVAVPTYNVGADGHEEVSDDDGGNPEVFHATMTMESLENWMVDFYGEMPVAWSDDTREEISMMCADMIGTDEGEITEDCFDHWIDMTMSDEDHGFGDCPFDADNPDSPCNAEVCHDEGSDECEEYTENYCSSDSGSTDSMCEIFTTCIPGGSVIPCMAAMYDHCESDSTNSETAEMCADMLTQDDNGIYRLCSTEYENATGDCNPNFFMGVIAYERGYITDEEFLDNYFLDFYNEFYGDDHMDHYEPVLFELSHITLEHDAEDPWTINPDYLQFEQPGFVCGNHVDHEDGNGTIPFYWVNDGYDDCGDGSDEQWYDNNTPDDHSDNCQKSYYNDSEECEGEEVNWFDCHDGSKIWIWQVNNDEWDCQDGEDEYRHSYWHGELYLYDGHLSSIDELNDGNVIARENHYCDWADEDMIEVECDNIILGDLQGEYTLATVSYCDENWEYYYDEDNDEWMYVLNETSPYYCNYWGDFSHELISYHGESHTEYINGSVDQDSFGMFNRPDCDDFIIESCEGPQFVLFNYYGITVPTGEYIDDYLISGAWECYYYDERSEPSYCYPASTSLYLYDGYADFNGSDEEWYDGVLIDSNRGFDDNYDTEGYNCLAPLDSSCIYSRLHLELSEGYYTIVTATTYTYETGIGYGNYWLNDTYSSAPYSSSSILENSYWDNEWSGGRDISAVSADEEGNITVNFTQAFETDGNSSDIWIEFYYWNDEWQEWYYLNSDGFYDYDTLTNFTCGFNCSEGWDGESEIMIRLYAYGNHTVVHWSSVTGNLEFVDPEFHQGDDRHHFPYAEWECIYDCEDDPYDYFDQEFAFNFSQYISGDWTASEVAQNVVKLMRDMDDLGMWTSDADDDGVPAVGWNDEAYHYCEWEGEPDDNDRWSCYNDEGGNGTSIGYQTWWYYCEHYTDDDGTDIWICTDSFGQHPNYEFFAENTHYEDGTIPSPDDYEHEEDDNPALLDGIIGVNDPEDPNPMPMSENIIGAVSDNEGLPMMMGTTFKVHFEGADDSSDTHELYIPIGEDGEDWHVEISLLERYEVISCDGCEDLEIDGSDAKFHANEPVTIIFGSRPGCDHVVGLDSTGYAFEPADLTINVGETVCWQWEGAADVHNVLELESEFDEDMDLTAVSVGFFSGEPSNTVDFRHTFTDDNMTHYYVCEPHATMGMVGKITVGEGSEEDPVADIAEESGLPSVGFVVSVLALIGAVGLRRRIH